MGKNVTHHSEQLIVVTSKGVGPSKGWDHWAAWTKKTQPNGWCFLLRWRITRRDLAPQKNTPSDVEGFIDLKFISCFFFRGLLRIQNSLYRLNSIVFGRWGCLYGRVGLGFSWSESSFLHLQEFPWRLAGQKLSVQMVTASDPMNKILIGWSNSVVFFWYTPTIPTGFWIIFDQECAWWQPEFLT